LPRHSPAQVRAHDLNLPGSDGREATEAGKSDDNLKAIPVTALTTSSDERNVQRRTAYARTVTSRTRLTCIGLLKRCGD